MAVFVCCADESADMNPRQNFFYGGFVAPVSDWDTFFADAWNERVLVGPPTIPYVHMTEMRSQKWRTAQGITAWEADRRLDEAARVIGGAGALMPVLLSVGEAEFNSLMGPFSPPRRRKSFTATEEPDYLAFLAFAMSVLHLVKDHHPDVEKVDFWVERKDRTTERLEYLHSQMPKMLTELGWTETVPLIGKFLPVGKDRIPAQAADVVCWHARNYEKGTLDLVGGRRYHDMVNGHIGLKRDLTDLILRELHERLKARTTNGAA